MSNLNQKQRILQNYSIVAVECVCIILSYLLALMTRGISPASITSQALYFTPLIFALFFHVLAYFLLDWNVAFFKRGYFVELIAVLKYNLVLILAFSFFLFFGKIAEDFSRLAAFYFFGYNLALTYVSHLLLKKFFVSYYRNSISSSKVLVVTTREQAEPLLKNMLKSPEWSFEITGLILMDEDMANGSVEGIPVVACETGLYEYMKTAVVDEIFLHLPDHSRSKLEELIMTFDSMGISVHVNIDYFNNVMAHRTTDVFAGFTVLSYEATNFDYRRLLIKRCMDILGALVGILITLILLPFIALAIKLDSKGPVFFSQTRVGKNGRYFKMYKFRSMYTDAEERKKELMTQNEVGGPMFKMKDDPRITKVGAFLRKTSLDELPQFFNILTGSMSLVGTRPPTVDEFRAYELYYRRRLSIKPGLTGLWQISGRSDIKDFKDVVKLDLQYIDNWTLSSDIRILLMTIWVVIAGKGAK